MSAAVSLEKAVEASDSGQSLTIVLAYVNEENLYSDIVGSSRNDCQHSLTNPFITFSLLGYATLLTVISRPAHSDLIEGDLIIFKIKRSGSYG